MSSRFSTWRFLLRSFRSKDKSTTGSKNEERKEKCLGKEVEEIRLISGSQAQYGTAVTLGITIIKLGPSPRKEDKKKENKGEGVARLEKLLKEKHRSNGFLITDMKQQWGVVKEKRKLLGSKACSLDDEEVTLGKSDKRCDVNKSDHLARMMRSILGSPMCTHGRSNEQDISSERTVCRSWFLVGRYVPQPQSSPRTTNVVEYSLGGTGEVLCPLRNGRRIQE
ncbi:hypothetical protein M0802_009731 [Mischocyttarus mexicanus]|nr:hypothetical protein M0802_009731 [Mischocyttarus mexicanus]